jgi:hypothetical protein
MRPLRCRASPSVRVEVVSCECDKSDRIIKVPKNATVFGIRRNDLRRRAVAHAAEMRTRQTCLLCHADHPVMGTERSSASRFGRVTLINGEAQGPITPSRHRTRLAISGREPYYPQ